MNTEQFEIKGRDYTRAAWFLPGPNQAHPLCVVLDAEHYLHSMSMLSVLNELMAAGLIPRMSIVFLSHNGAQSRHEDYTCNDRFARYVAEDVVSWAKGQLSSITCGENVICGVSLSGLASAHIALTFPLVFSASLCQSGSFWWNSNHFAKLANNSAPTQSRFWLSVGDKEVDENVFHPPTSMHQKFSQIVGVQSAVDSLQGRGAQVNYHVFNGGHEFAPWTAELKNALPWLFGSGIPLNHQDNQWKVADSAPF